MLLPPNQHIRVVKIAPLTQSGASATDPSTDPSADAHDRSAWTLTMTSRDWRVGADLYKDAPDGSVIRALVMSHDVVLKTTALTGLKGFIQPIMGTTRAHRQWAGTQWLRSVGLHAPRALAIIRGTRDTTRAECLVMEHVPGHTLLWHIARGTIAESPDGPGARAIAYAVGRDIARIIKAGRFNRDHKPSNLVVETITPAARIAIVDAVAILPIKATERGDAMGRMLAALMIEPAGVGHPAPEPFLSRVAQSLAHEIAGAQDAETWAKAMLERARTIVKAHGDPKPRHDPLRETPPPTPRI
jgi:tRNA A-37 threonylcarbamoyl transferase component Bud32